MHYECIRMHIYIIYLTQTLICIRTHHTFVINWYTHLFVFLPLAASGSLFRFSVQLHPIGCCYVGQYWLAATEWQVPPTFRLPVTAFPADSCRFFAEPPLCTSISYLIVMFNYHYVRNIKAFWFPRTKKEEKKNWTKTEGMWCNEWWWA